MPNGDNHLPSGPAGRDEDVPDGSAEEAAGTPGIQRAQQQTQGEPSEPAVAPVTGLKDIPSQAPVETISETLAVATHGVELTKFLLTILLVSIVILTGYLIVLDSITSARVDAEYDRLFHAISKTANRRVDDIDGLSSFLKSAKAATPEKRIEEAVILNAKNTLNELTKEHDIVDQDASELSKCVDSASLPIPKPPDFDTQIDKCTRILDSTRYFAGGPMDIDRLRLMRDFVKDAQEHHQSFRTFWISATQLILVNVLLPLLTALLGYIFGRQSAQGAPKASG